MPLEAGVRKVTAEPAAVLELRGRGSIEVGQAADIAVWDLETLDPGPMRRVADFPGGSVAAGRRSPGRVLACACQWRSHSARHGQPARRP